MSVEIPRAAFRHLLRVRVGAAGPHGRLYECEARDGHRYWKVKLDGGEWMWPNGLVIDGVGDRVMTCRDCGSPFISERDELLCPPCNQEQFGRTELRANEPADRSAATRRWWREHSKSATKESDTCLSPRKNQP